MIIKTIKTNNSKICVFICIFILSAGIPPFCWKKIHHVMVCRAHGLIRGKKKKNLHLTLCKIMKPGENAHIDKAPTPPPPFFPYCSFAFSCGGG